MAVSVADVEKIAALARLSFTDGEKKKLCEELNAILAYMEQLNGLDTSGVAPLDHVIGLENVFRSDEPRQCLTAEEALSGAPSKAGRFFRVPRAIGDR